MRFLRPFTTQLPFFERRAVQARVVPVAVLTVLLTAAFAQAPQSGPRPKRVHATLDGFDVAPRSANSPNQVAGASRGLDPQLYAPREGKSYSIRPTLSWAAGDAKTTYVVQVASVRDPQTLLVTQSVTGGSFTYPADAPTLEPGTIYIFKVKQENDMLGGAASVRIIIVGGKEREEIGAALSSAAVGSQPELAKARVYTEKRLWYDAVEAYTKLIAEHPDRTDLYQARSDIYDQLQQTRTLADADAEHIHP